METSFASLLGDVVHQKGSGMIELSNCHWIPLIFDIEQSCASSVLVGTVMVTVGTVWFPSVPARALGVAKVIVVLLLGEIGV